MEVGKNLNKYLDFVLELVRKGGGKMDLRKVAKRVDRACRFTEELKRKISADLSSSQELAQEITQMRTELATLDKRVGGTITTLEKLSQLL